MNRIRPGGIAALLYPWCFGVLGTGVLCACDSRREEPGLPPITSVAEASPVAAATRFAERSTVAQAESPRPTTSPGTMGGKAVSAADVEFVSSAASAGTLEVEASRVALEKSKLPAVRNFAQTMVDEHSKTGAELRTLTVASSVGNVAAMSPKDGDQLRKLKELQGREFDREYMAQIGVAAHQQAVGAFQRAADSASDNQVKTFAQAKLPALREHLKTAQALAKELGAPAAGSKSDPLATGSTK